MTTINQNELYAILRDLSNGNLTPMDASRKIQELNKTEIKETVPEPSPESEVEVEPSPKKTIRKSKADAE